MGYNHAFKNHESIINSLPDFDNFVKYDTYSDYSFD